MKALFFVTVLFSLSASAEGKKEYKMHFENPVADQRIELSVCALSGAVYGALTGEPGDVLCWGSLKSNPSKTYYVFRAAGSSEQHYFEETGKENLGGYSNDQAGIAKSAVKIREVSADLVANTRGHRSTLKFTDHWVNSDGGSWVKGRLPGGLAAIDAPVFSLSSIDEEMKDLKRELGN